MAQAYGVLNAEERDRAGRFKFASDRATYVLAHALLRRELERYTGVPAAALRFNRTIDGRPELALPPRSASQAATLRFSLAHTNGLVGCAVTASADVGFDLERVRERAPLELADRYFSPSEVAQLYALPPTERDRRFFTLWTLKEAYLKARGVGLSLALDCFAIEPQANGTAELELLSAHPREPRPWAFRWWDLATECVAVAVQMESKRLQQVVFDEEPF